MGNQLRHSYVDTKFKLITCKRIIKSVIKYKVKISSGTTISVLHNKIEKFLHNLIYKEIKYPLNPKGK